MTYSMTAFARVQKSMETHSLVWELKSINHRYLEITFRLPESLRFLEGALRPLVRDIIQRGKLECQLKVNEIFQRQSLNLMNHDLVEKLITQSKQLSEQFNLEYDLSISHLLQLPGVIAGGSLDEEKIIEPVTKLFSLALEALIKIRLQEGEALKDQIMLRVNHIGELLNQVRSSASGLGLRAREKLLQKLKQLDMESLESRLEQEIAFMLTRLDVHEEIDRIDFHLKEVARTLECDKVSGRRLDFLMQELNRETNTLSSKSDSTDLTQLAVQIKVLIEQMREQIQNIE